MDQTLTRRGRAFAACRRWFVHNFAGTEPALCHLAAVMTALIAGNYLASNFWPETVGSIVSVIAIFGLAELVLWLAKRLLGRLLGHGLGWLLSLAALGVAVTYTVQDGSGEGWSWRVYLLAGGMTCVLWLLAASWYSLLARRTATPTVVCSALLSAGLTVLLAAFLFTDGFDNHYIDEYLSLSNHQENAQTALEPSLTAGAHPVEMLDYGPDQVLEAGTISLTQYMSRGDEDLTDYYVDVYWDYDLSEVPMQGRIWYPADAENCPVLFIAHGNHHIATESYLGYGYLGEYLASHGYVVVSVDQNACNMLTNENDGRAVLLLEHIELLLQYNSAAENPLYRRLDADNIAIAGHSRGGEMVATAYLFNEYDRYPENGVIRFSYDFDIKSIIAIAPTVNQYKPADHSVALEDVNYLLLHGAADRDVTNFMGMSQYENISFTGEGDYLKSALYIAGANHGQFNELWGQYDQRGPFTTLFNPASLISQSDQQQIARVFIKVFLDVTLRGDTSCRSLLTDWDDYAAQLPQTVYAQCYETSGFAAIADFEEDSDLETVTVPEAEVSAVGFNWWTEELVNFAGTSSYDTHALRLRWTKDASYTLKIPQTDASGQFLRFDICDLDEGAVEAGELALVDGRVVLTDASGRTASAWIRDHATVYPILPVRTDKLDFLFDTCTYKKAFSTVSIPVERFVPDDASFDSTRVARIAIHFERGGQVMVDNIGLERA